MLILGDYRVGPQVLSFAYNDGMTDGEYAFILVQLDHEQFKRNLENEGQYNLVQFGNRTINSCEYFRAFESVIVVEIQTTEEKNETFEDFQEQVKEKFKDPTFPEIVS